MPQKIKFNSKIDLSMLKEIREDFIKDKLDRIAHYVPQLGFVVINGIYWIRNKKKYRIKGEII